MKRQTQAMSPTLVAISSLDRMADMTVFSPGHEDWESFVEHGGLFKVFDFNPLIYLKFNREAAPVEV